MLKAVRGENPYEIPADALFTQKVNGVEEQVSIQDLLTNYSGKVAYDKKFNELGQQRQDLVKREATLNDRVDTFLEKSKEDPLDGLAYLAETSGANPVELIKNLRERLVPNMEEYMNMDETQRELFHRNEELNILKKSQETKSQMERMHQERASLEQSRN